MTSKIGMKRYPWRSRSRRIHAQATVGELTNPASSILNLQRDVSVAWYRLDSASMVGEEQGMPTEVARQSMTWQRFCLYHPRSRLRRQRASSWHSTNGREAAWYGSRLSHGIRNLTHPGGGTTCFAARAVLLNKGAQTPGHRLSGSSSQFHRHGV